MSWNKCINLSYRCLFPIFGQPLLTACIWRRAGTFNEHHARRLPSRVSIQAGPPSERHTLRLCIYFFLLCFQDIAGRWDGVPDAGLVRVGKHILHHRLPVWTLGPRCLAVLRWSVTLSNHTLHHVPHSKPNIANILIGADINTITLAINRFFPPHHS